MANMCESETFLGEINSSSISLYCDKLLWSLPMSVCATIIAIPQEGIDIQNKYGE